MLFDFEVAYKKDYWFAPESDYYNTLARAKDRYYNLIHREDVEEVIIYNRSKEFTILRYNKRKQKGYKK